MTKVYKLPDGADLYDHICPLQSILVGSNSC